MAAGEDEKKDEIPAFKFTDKKKVDDSWKEEVRREREAAAARIAAQQKAVAPIEAALKDAAPGKSVAPAGKTTFDSPAPESADAEIPAVPDPASPTSATPGAGSTAPAAKPQTAIEQQQTKIFLNFLEGLAQQALMQLGEMENPYTGQAEMDLQGARYTLELLATIQVKTKGNLSEGEAKALGTVLNDLRQTFTVIAQEMQRQMAAQKLAGGPMPPGAR